MPHASHIVRVPLLRNVHALQCHGSRDAPATRPAATLEVEVGPLRLLAAAPVLTPAARLEEVSDAEAEKRCEKSVVPACISALRGLSSRAALRRLSSIAEAANALGGVEGTPPPPRRSAAAPPSPSTDTHSH